VNGVRGIINEDFLDLSMETTHNLQASRDAGRRALLHPR
jgi:hypothetical protein